MDIDADSYIFCSAKFVMSQVLHPKLVKGGTTRLSKNVFFVVSGQ